MLGSGAARQPASNSNAQMVACRQLNIAPSPHREPRPLNPASRARPAGFAPVRFPHRAEVNDAVTPAKHPPTPTQAAEGNESKCCARSAAQTPRNRAHREEVVWVVSVGSSVPDEGLVPPTEDLTPRWVKPNSHNRLQSAGATECGVHADAVSARLKGGTQRRPPKTC